ncbi:MAG: PHP domain-containing protein, partial [Lachnospiraceae bacterium]
GIATIYSTYTRGEENHMRTLAVKYDLLITGGSDFHGSNKPDIDLGTGKGSLQVPDNILASLYDWRKAQYGV